MSKIILETKNLTKIYKNTQRGIKKINLKVKQGKFYGLIGPNGAGKTTLIKSIVGTYTTKNYSGQIFLKDKLLSSYQKDDPKKIAYVPEKTIFPSWLKVIDYLKFLLIIDFPNSKQVTKKINDIAKELKWEYLLNRHLKKLSSGESKKVLILQAFATDPELIIMDEPNENLDPDTRVDILNYCQKQVKNGMTIIISSHVLKEIESYIDEAIFIFDGKLENLPKNNKIKTLHLVVDNFKILEIYLNKHNYQFTNKINEVTIDIYDSKQKQAIFNYCMKNKIEIIKFDEQKNNLLATYREIKKQNSIKNK